MIKNYTLLELVKINDTLLGVLLVRHVYKKNINF